MKQKKSIIIGFILLFVVVLFSNAALKDDGEPRISKNKTWQQILMEERRDKDHEFKTSPDSPMAGLKRFNVDANKKTFVLENNGEVTLSDKKETGAAFSLLYTNDKWSWECLNPSVTCTAGETKLEAGAVLPGRTIFNLGRCTVITYPLSGRLVLVVFDPKRPQIEEFSHLLYFPPDPKYAVNAVLEKYANPEKIKILTSRNEIKIYHKYAKIRFQLDGKPFQLTAYKFSLNEQSPASKYLFIPFSDATSGKETYEVGRFLEIDEPANDRFVLDFNRCFNPLCNYAPVYNCPVPPLENHLAIAIKAGEKTYPH